MIVVEINTALTAQNLSEWYTLWKKDTNRLATAWEIYTNKNGMLKLPYAKKLVITSAAATLGDGITVSAPESLDASAKITFDEIITLLKKQTIINHDKEVIRDMAIYGRAYELVYMSDDEVPVPKSAVISARNAFVVFDNTVEHNSLYGVYFESYKKQSPNGVLEDWIRFFVSDNVYTYEYDTAASVLQSADISAITLTAESGIPHHIGRVPLTEIRNNYEEQGDFEQVAGLIADRTDLHNLNLKDTKAIAKNYLKSKGVRLVGRTDKEKDLSQLKMADSQRIEMDVYDNGMPPDPNTDVNILSKNENYTSITEFGHDIDSKIYDLSMIPDLSSEQFAGNQSGVALELKLMPFKEMVKSKDAELEKLYRRRLKMYAFALKEKGYAPLDAAACTITTNRNWTRNITEIAQLISTLKLTGLFSDKTLTNLYPDTDYDDEQAQLANEAEAARIKSLNNPIPNNSSAEWLAAALSKETSVEGENNDSASTEL